VQNLSPSDRNRTQTRVALVAGPKLAHAKAEVDGLHTLYPDATVLVGADANAAAVTSAMATADLAHVAAHGRFRSDNPLLSALELADGPLTVYDLERLGRAPDTLILSACDAGLSSVHPGDELMGLTAALLGLGCRSLIASVVPVPDEGTRRLMDELHAHLVNGAHPAKALHHAQVWAAPQGGQVAAAALGFTCFGR
jgi:CHAT domain-containing protein